jgi:hypothetical protein
VTQQQKKVKAIYKIIHNKKLKQQGYENLPVELAVKAKLYAPTQKEVQEFQVDGALIIFWDDKQSRLECCMEGLLPQFFQAFPEAIMRQCKRDR